MASPQANPLREDSGRSAAGAAELVKATFCHDETDSKVRSCNVLWQVGAPLLFFPVLIFALATLWLMLGGTISRFAAWVILPASAVAALSVWRLFLSGGWRFAPLVTLALGSSAFLLSSLVYDTSIDGQHYHFQAIYALVEGWNPYRDVAPPVIADPATLWAVHYPRATWTISATFLAAGMPLSAVKAINFLVFFASFALITATLFRFGFSWALAILFAGLAVLNPIVVSQLFTSMNDGLLGLCMLVFVASMATWIRYRDPAVLASGLAALVLGLNLKFSSIPIFAVLCAFVCLGAFAVRGLRTSAELAAALLSTTLVAVVVLGWSPYLQNLIHHGHIFYPVMGSEPVDIMIGNTPKVLEGLPAPYRFLYSLFSETHAGYETFPPLKVPLTLSAEELRAAGGVDVRIAGFGPFFSGAFVLAVIAAGLLLWKAGLKRQPAGWLLLIAAGFLVSVMLMPQNWWARYVPQLWFVPICIAAGALAVRIPSARILGLTVAGILLIDAAVVSGAATWLAAKRSHAASTQVADLIQSGKSYCVNPAMAQSRIHIMREAGLDVRFAPPDAISCDAPQEISAYGPDRFGGSICPCP